MVLDAFQPPLALALEVATGCRLRDRYTTAGVIKDSRLALLYVDNDGTIRRCVR